MKKLLLFTNVVTLALLILTRLGSCQADTNTDTSRNKRLDTNLSSKTGPRGSSVTISPNPTTSCYGIGNLSDLQGVTLGYAEMLLTNYRKQQWTTIRKTNGVTVRSNLFNDARSAWFSLETIKRFIREVERRTCVACEGSSNKLGVRIYYGTYPSLKKWDSFDMTGVERRFAGHHTLLWVPTYSNEGNSFNTDFDPRQPFAGRACLPSGFNGLSDTVHILAMDARVQNNTAYENHGGNWPPPYDGRFESAEILATGQGMMEEGTKVATEADR